MPAPKDRTRGKRRVFVRAPSGENKRHLRRQKPGKPECAMCGCELNAVVRGTPSVVAKIPKTQRRPERPYGGVLCSKCMRKKITEGARK